MGLAQKMEGAALYLSAPPQPGPSRAPRALSPSLQRDCVTSVGSVFAAYGVVSKFYQSSITN